MKLRSFEQEGRRYFSLGVPPHIGRELPDVEYECKITSNGLLYQPAEPPPPVPIDWARRRRRKK